MQPDPNQQQQLLQYLQALVASGQLPGINVTAAPDPVAPLDTATLLHTLAAQTRWHTEDQHNQVHAGIDAFVSRLDQLEQDLASIRARIGVYTQPVTPQAAQVAAAAGQPIPPQLVSPPAAPAPVGPFMATPPPAAPAAPFPGMFNPFPNAPAAPPAAAPAAPFPGIFHPVTGAPIVPPSPTGGAAG